MNMACIVAVWGARAPHDPRLGKRFPKGGVFYSLLAVLALLLPSVLPTAASAQNGGRAGTFLTFDALGEDVYEAPIRYVGSTVDPQNRTFSIEVEVPNETGDIKPQMVANMSLTRREVGEALVVPQDALVRVEDGYIVYVVADGPGGTVAEARPVELGPARRNLVVIESGVSVGERLIVVGHKSVAEGDRVNVVQGRSGG